jgi:hypothetical protein
MHINAPQAEASGPAQGAPLSNLPPIAKYLIAAIVVSLIAGAAYWWSQSGSAEGDEAAIAGSAPIDQATAQSWFESYEDEFLSEQGQFYITGTSRVRNYPTSQGTEALETFEQRRPVTGRWVRGGDPTTRWLKLSSGGYVWEGNVGDSTTIYPSGLGGFFVESSYSELSGVFYPEGIYGYGPDYCETYMSLDDTFSAMFEGNRATSFVTSDTKFVTQKGVRVGMSVTELQAAYEGMLERQENKYGGADYYFRATPDRGIRFYVGMNATVEIMHAGTKSIEYAEGCL